MAEQDRVETHHRRLEVDREQQSLGLGLGDWAARNSSSAATCIAVASTSPARTGTDSRSTVVAPSSPSARSAGCLDLDVVEVLLERKSSAVMCATLVSRVGDQAPIECGWVRRTA